MKKKLFAITLVTICTALLLAARETPKDSNGALVEPKDSLGRPLNSQDEVSSIQSAIKKTIPRGDEAMEKEDQERDFDDFTAKSEHGVTRMMMMAFHNRPEVFKKALEAFLNQKSHGEGDSQKWTELRDKEGSGLLHWAAMGDCTECVDILLAKGFPVDQVNKRGETALVFAASSGDELLTSKLLEAGADPNIKFNDAGYTLLMDASFEGQTSVASSLIKAKAKINLQDKEGKSPLHYAAREGHSELVELLLRSGANPDLIDQNGKKALDYGVEYHGNAFKSHFSL